MNDKENLNTDTEGKKDPEKTENDESDDAKVSKTSDVKVDLKKRRPKGQNLLESLGLTTKDQEELEKKLFLVKYFDLFSEQTLSLIYKNKFFEKYTKEFTEKVETLGEYREEDKILKKGFNDKQIVELLYRLKERAEKIAADNGITKPIEKRLQKFNFAIIIPVFGITIILMMLNLLLGVDLMPLAYMMLCVGCLAPNLIKGTLLRKMYNFQDEHQNELYTENREDLVVLKGYINEILENIRSSLLEKKVPLQIIKFQLLSGDYTSLQVIREIAMRKMPGQKQHLVCFEYPEGMEPYPIPEQWQQSYPIPGQKKIEKLEKNFVLLSELKTKDGKIESFVPHLKEPQADKINEMLNNCEFSDSPEAVENIIPSDLAIYCTCGEITKIQNTQICNWKNQFKFYLFVGESCKCGESIYALSLTDENAEVPEELQDIFSI